MINHTVVENMVLYRIASELHESLPHCLDIQWFKFSPISGCSIPVQEEVADND